MNSFRNFIALVRTRFVVSASLALCAAACSAQAPSTGLIGTQSIAVNPVTSTVYAVEHDGGAVSALRGTTRLSIPAGKAPVAVAINPHNNRIYVANHDSDTVTVIDGATNHVLANAPVGRRPYLLAVNPNTDEVFVSGIFSNALDIIDGKTDTVTTLHPGSFDVSAVDAKRNKIYLLSYESPKILVLDGATHAISKIEVGPHIWGMALDEVSGTLYISRVGSGDVLAVTSDGQTQSPVRVGNMPCALALDAASHRLFALNYSDASVSIVDTETHKVLSTIPLTGRPQALAFDARTHKLYVADPLHNTVSVIDGMTNRVLSQQQIPGHPYALASLPSGMRTATLDTPFLTALHP